jgi:hypothetical protein
MLTFYIMSAVDRFFDLVWPVCALTSIPLFIFALYATINGRRERRENEARRKRKKTRKWASA